MNFIQKKKRGIYYPLYTENFSKYLTEQFYPGNDTKPNHLYCKIINHFKNKPNEGCYVCLCKKGFYHSVKSGFPGAKEFEKYCPGCKKNIGTEKKAWYSSEKIIVKRSDYYRIFKSKKEIDDIKNNKNYKNKLDEINYMTIDEYKKKYIVNDKETQKKGVFINVDKNDFKNDTKVVRELDQISFRILNYILYSHLFFARLITDKKNDFEKYLPKGMSWVKTINECWNILKNELLKENIMSIEKFMSYIFSDLFPILNKEQKIDDYKSLLEFEKRLNTIIQDCIKKYKDYIKANPKYMKDKQDKNSFISLLKEKYTKLDYNEKDYPFYEYFYYSDYLDEKYIAKQLSIKTETQYPVLQKYIESRNNQVDNTNNYSLNNLNLFNKVINLINENYNNKIPRAYAEKNNLKEEKIYNENYNDILKFIDFINSTQKEVQLKADNKLRDFLLDDKNEFCIIYKNIYKKFAEEQNKKLENLLDIKINSGIFDMNCKNRINIQQIDEKGIFTLSFPKEISFIDILFNSSYRKIIDSDNRSNDSYKEYEINYELIEEYMTDLLLKNKKLLNEDVTEFNYNDEVFSNQVTDLISKFCKRINRKDIDIYDKLPIYKFYKDNKYNTELNIKIINDFITLIKLKKEKSETKNDNKEGNNFIILEETKIYEIIDKFKTNFTEDNFIKIFDKNDNLTYDKTCELFLYYLKLVYELIKSNLNNYQEKLNEKSKKVIDNYYIKEHIISKKDLACAIRLFTSFVLFSEEDKNKKIQMNRNNVINYLRAPDLWIREIYENEEFNKNLNELKSFNVQINQIIDLYEYLGKDIENNFNEKVEKQIEMEESQKKESEAPNNFDNDDDEDQFAGTNEEDVAGDRY